MMTKKNQKITKKHSKIIQKRCHRISLLQKFDENLCFFIKKGHISIKNTKITTELSTRNPESVTVTCLLTNFEHDEKKEPKNNKKSFKNHSKTMSPNIFTSKNCREMMFFRKKMTHFDQKYENYNWIKYSKSPKRDGDVSFSFWPPRGGQLRNLLTKINKNEKNIF